MADELMKRVGSTFNVETATPAEAAAFVAPATTSLAGTLSASDKTKLDSIAANANAFAFTTGSTIPSDASGANGDVYYRTSNGAIYKKVSGTWGSPLGFVPLAVLAAVALSGIYSDLTGKPTLGSAAALNVPTSNEAASNEVVKGSDIRLSSAVQFLIDAGTTQIAVTTKVAFIDVTTSFQTFLLPNAATFGTGRQLIIKNRTNSNHLISVGGIEGMTIEGTPSWQIGNYSALSSEVNSVILVSDGANWLVVSGFNND